jgi:hypothetical protein
MELANTARQSAMDTGKAMAEKAMDKLPDLIKAETEAKKQEKKEEDENKAKAEGEVKKEQDVRKGKLEDLAKNANAYAQRAGVLVPTSGDNTEAKKWVASLLEDLGIKVEDLSSSENAILYNKYTITNADKDPVIKRGKEAFLEILKEGV